jgi:transcriptional accessory protein Tex/SPT6
MNNIADNDIETTTDPDSFEPNSEEQIAKGKKKEGAEASMDDLMDLYEESFKRFAEGEVVTGRIISVDKDHVLVDIGYKSEGQIRINEFMDERGQISAQPGDRIEVMVEWWDDENEVVVLSKEKAEKVKVWDNIKKATTRTAPSRAPSRAGSRAASRWTSGSWPFCPAPRRTCAPSATWTTWSARPSTSRS